MKNAIIVFTVAALLAGGISSCGQSTAEKSVVTKERESQDAQNKRKEDAAIAEQNAVDAKEWQAFRAETENRIKANDNYVAELKAKAKATGRDMDASLTKNMNALEQKNKDLRARMESYGDKGLSDWGNFKREFNHDMDELGKALKDLTVDNKN